MGLENHTKTKGELHIQTDDLSVYGHIMYGDKRYDFQVVYTESDILSQKIVFDEPTPYEDQWHSVLKNMLILQHLL